jgi:hypothetical protein
MRRLVDLLRTVPLTLVPLMVVLAVGSVSCSGGSSSAQLPTTLPPTACATDAPVGVPVVKVTVASPVDGTGSMSLLTQGSVLAGTVRLVVEADATNDDVTDVAVTRGPDASEVVVVRGVAAGDTCGVDVELAAGAYTAASGGRSVQFSVVAA